MGGGGTCGGRRGLVSTFIDIYNLVGGGGVVAVVFRSQDSLLDCVVRFVCERLNSKSFPSSLIQIYGPCIYTIQLWLSKKKDLHICIYKFLNTYDILCYNLFLFFLWGGERVRINLLQIALFVREVVRTRYGVLRGFLQYPP